MLECIIIIGVPVIMIRFNIHIVKIIIFIICYGIFYVRSTHSIGVIVNILVTIPGIPLIVSTQWACVGKPV